MALRDLTVRIGADTSGFQRGMKSVLSGIRSLVSTAAAIAGVTAGITGLVQAFKAYTALESNVKRTSDLFGESAKYIEYFANTTAKSLGMAESSAYEYAATYGNLFKNITADSSENAKVTIEMLKASSVVASKTGRTMEDVMERIRSGLLGNTEAIEDLGINVNVAMLEVTDAFKQIADGRSWEQLTFYEQQQVRTLAILEQADKNFGNEVQTGSAYSLSVLSGAFKDLISTAGTFINKAIQPVIAWLTKITQAATAALKSLAALMGLNLTSDTGSLTDGFATSADSSAEISGNMSDTVDSAKELKKQLAGFDELNVLAKSTDTESEKDSASAGKGGSSVFDSLPALEYRESELDTSGVEKKLDRLKEKLQPVRESISGLWDALKPLKDFAAEGLNNFYSSFLYPVGNWVLGEGLPRFIDILSGGIASVEWDNINDHFDKLWKALAPFAVNAGEGLLWLWENVLVPFGAWTANELLPVFLDTLAGVIDVLNSVVEAFKPLGKWLWEKFLKPLSKWAGGIVTDGLEKLAGALEKLSEWIKENPNAAVWFFVLAGGVLALDAACSGGAILTFFSKISAVVGTIASLDVTVATIIAGIAGWIYAITEIANNWDDIISVIKEDGGFFSFIGNWIDSCREEIEEFFASFGILGELWCEFWEDIGEVIYTVFNDVPSWLKNKFTEAWENIKSAFSSVKEFFNEKWDDIKSVFTGIPDWFKSKFTQAWNNVTIAFLGVKAWFSNRWNDITGVFSGTASWFKDKFQTAWDNIRSVFSISNITSFFTQAWGGITGIFGNVQAWFKERFQSAWDGAKGVFDDVSDFFSGVKESILEIWDDIGNGIKNAINWVIGKINSFISALNGISFTNPFSGNTVGFDIPQIPELATGGIVEKPTVAMIGEAGAEAIVPLENNTGWIDKIAEKISASVPSGASGDIIVRLEVDGREFRQAVVKAVEMDKARRGG